MPSVTVASTEGTVHFAKMPKLDKVPSPPPHFAIAWSPNVFGALIFVSQRFEVSSSHSPASTSTSSGLPSLLRRTGSVKLQKSYRK